MLIRGFRYFVEEHLQQLKLNNSTVVIDGHNIFYNMYQKSKLPYVFGSESDRFADYLRKYLTKFVLANVKCIFLFKGGHDTLDAFNFHLERPRFHGDDYIVGGDQKEIIRPIFINDICFQILDEMGFEYVICLEDVVMECIGLSRKLSCPVIAFNVEYFFSPVQYIPEPSIDLDGHNNLQCGVITLSHILNKYNLTVQKIVCFATLTDQYIFEKGTFNCFFKSINLPLHKRYCTTFYRKLLKWLACIELTQALNEIFKTLSKCDKPKFEEEKAKLEETMRKRREEESRTAPYLRDKNNLKITDLDTEWFEKGIFLKYIPIPYINLYRYKVLKPYNCIEDCEQEQSVILSVDIVKYAFDLLTNFKGGEIHIAKRKSSSKDLHQVPYDYSIQRPPYEADSSFFENGWETIKQLNLFQHFLEKSLQSVNFSLLDRAPADCRLLLIAMVYFSCKKTTEVRSEMCSVLLSYVMLAVVSGKVSKHSNKYGLDVTDKPLKDCITDKDSVNADDCEIAWSIMNEYFEMDDFELTKIFSRQAVHPLIEFQYCLQQLNYLNRLCGSPYVPTIFSKTYNGTFVYKVLHYMRLSGFEDGYQFIQSKLNPAPTVFAFFRGLLETYEYIMHNIS